MTSGSGDTCCSRKMFLQVLPKVSLQLRFGADGLGPHSALRVNPGEQTDWRTGKKLSWSFQTLCSWNENFKSPKIINLTWDLICVWGHPTSWGIISCYPLVSRRCGWGLRKRKKKGNGIFNNAEVQLYFWRFRFVLSCRLWSFRQGELDFAICLELLLLTLK